MTSNAAQSGEPTSPTSKHFRPRRGVGTQALLLTAATGFSQLATAVMYIIAARRSEPADFGIIVAAIAAGSAITGLLDFGSNAYWTREIARGAETGQSLSTRATGKLLVSVGAAAVLAAVVFVVAPDSRFWVAGLIGCGLLLSQTSRVPLGGAGRGDLAAIPLAVDRLLAAGLMIALTELGTDAPNALWIALVVGALASTLVARALTPGPNRLSLRFKLRERPWAGAKGYGLTAVSVSAQQLDLTILSAVSSPGAAALYGAVSRWTQPMSLMASAFASSAAPFIANSGQFSQAWARIKRAVWLPAAAILFSVSVAVAAPLAVHLLLGDQYEGSVPVLRLLALAAIPSIVNQVCVVGLQALGHDGTISRIMAGTVTVHLILVGVLAVPYGAIGAAIASASIQWILLAVLLGYVVRVRRLSRSRHGVTVTPDDDSQRDQILSGPATRD